MSGKPNPRQPEFNPIAPPAVASDETPPLTAAGGSPRYWPALDGLRAVAVLAVLIFHAGASWLPAGFLGVDVFFVISGFLITTLLVREHERCGGISLGRFWLRRAGRLLPALLLMLAGVIAYLAVAAPGLVLGFWEDVRFALLFVSNWDFLLRDVSYFAQWDPSLGSHLWSLAVEEQFYLVWPPLAALMLRFGGVRAVACGAAALALLSALLMGALYVPFADVSRVYYGTDTHAFGLAVGALLGCLVHLYPKRIAGRARPRQLLGVLALLLVLGAMALLHEWDGFLYRGGYLAVALLTGLVTLAAIADRGVLVAALGWRPLGWIGRRSYAVYLWHWPLLLLPGPALELAGNPIALPDWLELGLRLALVFAAAAISWHLVETPLRTAVGEASRATASGGAAVLGVLRAKIGSARTGAVTATAALIGVLVLGGFAGAGLFEQSVNPIAVQIDANAELLQTSRQTRVPVQQQRPGQVVPVQVETVRSPLPPEPVPPRERTPPRPNVPDRSDRQLTPEVVAYSSNVVSITYVPSLGPPPPTFAAQPQRVLAIGDSVMLGAADVLLETLPEMEIEAAVSAQFLEGMNRIRRAMELPFPERPRVVVLHLGTNGIFDPSYVTELRGFSDSLRRLVVINIRVPRAWEGFVNEQLAQVADWQKVEYIDWHQASAERPEWLTEDNVHLTEAGKHAYAALIADAIS